jgi:hypothetical protein
MVISFFIQHNLSRRLSAEASLIVILERASPRGGAELQAADGRNSRYRHPAGSQGLGSHAYDMHATKIHGRARERAVL